MFTGVVEELGIVESVNPSGTGMTISISCKMILEDIHIGDSISIDGVCQTVVSFDSKSFTVFASKITSKLTNFSIFKKGTFVNLERALMATSRLGGHFVTGHVDGTGSITKRTTDASGIEFEVNYPGGLKKYIVKKGSIAINGVSLTVSEISNKSFSLYLIPETIERTNLKNTKIGNIVNIEVDILGKYAESMIDNKKESLNTLLEENGFM